MSMSNSMRKIPEVEIRPVATDEVEILERQLARGFAAKHRARLALQAAGKAVYLIAWRPGTPIGHVLLEWEGTNEEPLASNLKDCPILSDLFVVEDLRGRGIGSQLLRAVESLAGEHGYRQIALGVATNNPRAQALYERRGYQETGLGVYTSRWKEIDEHGQERWFEEAEVCLVKSLEVASRGF